MENQKIEGRPNPGIIEVPTTQRLLSVGIPHNMPHLCELDFIIYTTKKTCFLWRTF